jgi:hypothetical protein
MPTAQQIITSALLQLGVVRVGQTPASTELDNGLLALNRLLDSWSTERLLIPVVGANFYSLSGSQASYEVGPTATDFPGTRPIRIDSANFVQQQMSAVTVSFSSPLQLISESDYFAIVDKTATSDIVEKLYYAPSLPNGTFYLWPIPNVTSPCQLQVNAWTPLAEFPSLGTSVPLATGYERAIVFNLATNLQPDMVGSQLTPETIAIAQESKAYIAKLNALMLPESPDVAIPPSTTPLFEPVPAGLKAVAQAKSVIQQ